MTPCATWGSAAQDRRPGWPTAGVGSRCVRCCGTRCVRSGRRRSARWLRLRSAPPITIRTDSRIRSTPSPARNASSSSDTADWDMAIGGFPFSECLAVHTEDPADGPYFVGAALITLKTHHSRGRLPARWYSGLITADACGNSCRNFVSSSIALASRQDRRGRGAE